MITSVVLHERRKRWPGYRGGDTGDNMKGASPPQMLRILDEGLMVKKHV